MLISSVVFVPAAYAADARVYITSASPAKSGYAVDEAVIINAKIKWEDMTANQTISVQLWNSTDALETLESYVTPVDDNSTGTPTVTADGSYSPAYTPTVELSEEVGSETYYLKIMGSSGLTLDSQAFVILIADESVTLSVTWEDRIMTAWWK